MRGLVGSLRIVLAMASIGCAAGCAAHHAAPTNAGSAVPGPQVSGVWDAVTSGTIDEGVAAGDVKIEKQEWHLSQSGSAIRGYYIAALTYVSGDGRPYVCSRQPQFSALQRFEVVGHVKAGAIEIQELGQAENATAKPVRSGDAPAGAVSRLARRRRADAGQRAAADTALPHPRRDNGDDAGRAPRRRRRRRQRRARPRPRKCDQLRGTGGVDPPMPSLPGVANADVSGLWVWEHQGGVPGGDQKQEREEWHVEQNGSKISGYYDRIVHQVSTDGHAYRCSMALEFRCDDVTSFSGDISGDEVRISRELVRSPVAQRLRQRQAAPRRYQGKALGRQDLVRALGIDSGPRRR